MRREYYLKLGLLEHSAGILGVLTSKNVKKNRESKETWIEIVSDRKGPTLMNLSRRKIAPGTRIITDMWRGYNAIPRLIRGVKPIYKHETVNHSKNFLIPQIQTYIPKISSVYRGPQRRNKIQSGSHRQHLRGYIDEFLFRRHAKSNNICVFDTILNAIITYMPPF